MKYQTVVIRYNEDIEWTKYLQHPVIIYNKGEKIFTEHEVVELKNIGMYVASQLYYCIHNYDNLADYTFFVQGNPWDGLLESFNKLSGENINDVRSFEHFYYNIPKNEHASSNYIKQIINAKYVSPPNYNQRHHDYFIKFTHTWQEWIQEIDPKNKINWSEPARFYKNGHITLSKESILSNPKEWYLKILDFLKYDVPIIEWFTESTHNFIFNINNNGLLTNYEHKALDYKNKKLDYDYWLR